MVINPSLDILQNLKLLLGGKRPPHFLLFFFKFDSFVITDESAVALGELADKIITNPKYGKVRIEGYSDYVGGKVLNKIMSQRRAEAVRNYLELHGADTSNMKIEALGKTREFPGGREANRRVIFIIER